MNWDPLGPAPAVGKGTKRTPAVPRLLISIQDSAPPRHPARPRPPRQAPEPDPAPSPHLSNPRLLRGPR